MKFSIWLENKKKQEVQDAILGIVGDSLDLSPLEIEHLLGRNTKDFSSEIIDKIKNLGVLKREDDYGEITTKIDNGIKILDLINMVSN